MRQAGRPGACRETPAAPAARAGDDDAACNGRVQGNARGPPPSAPSAARGSRQNRTGPVPPAPGAQPGSGDRLPSGRPPPPGAIARSCRRPRAASGRSRPPSAPANGDGAAARLGRINTAPPARQRVGAAGSMPKYVDPLPKEFYDEEERFIRDVIERASEIPPGRAGAAQGRVPQEAVAVCTKGQQGLPHLPCRPDRPRSQRVQEASKGAGIRQGDHRALRRRRSRGDGAGCARAKAVAATFGARMFGLRAL